MKTILKNIQQNIIWTLLLGSFILSSCNKGFEEVPGPIATSGQTLGEKINTDPNYTIFRTALIRTGLMNVLSTPGNSLTVFAPDNNAFIASGLSQATVDVLPLTTLTPVVQYHIITSRIPSTSLPNSFSAASGIYPAEIPNAQMPTSLVLQAPFVRMNVFPTRNGSNAFVNNLPIVQPDVITGTNGVMHRIPFILQPPQQMVKGLIGADANLSLFRALISRADVGQAPGLGRLDSVMNFAPANITVFAPSNNAIKGLINVLSGGAVPLAAPDATFIAFIGANIPVATARGVLAYHMTDSRAFSVNLPLVTKTIRTLVGASPFPQLTVDRSTATPRLLGAANGPGNFSNFIATDRLGVNGVLHLIDRVLLPQ